MMLKLLDIFFTLLHLLIILINLFGWIFPQTRRLHLLVVCLTLGSWLILGTWYGIGYCPITDWQWQVKEKLGEGNLPSSFIKYFLDKISGKQIDAGLVDIVTVAGFGISLLAAFYFAWQKNKRRKKAIRQS